MSGVLPPPGRAAVVAGVGLALPGGEDPAVQLLPEPRHVCGLGVGVVVEVVEGLVKALLATGSAGMFAIAEQT